MRDHPDKSPDDVSTPSYRKERGEKVSAEDHAGAPVPSVGASIRGPIASEVVPEEDSASPGSDADRAAAKERDGEPQD